MRNGLLFLAALGLLLSGCATVSVTGTPLEKAIAKGDAKEVEALLKDGADPNRKDLLTRISPACRAIRARHMDILKILIAHGANIIKESDALYCAVDTGQIDFVQFLLDQGAPIGTFAYLRAQDHQSEILDYLKKVQEQREKLKKAPPPAPAIAASSATAEAFATFHVPIRPADAAVIIGVDRDVASAAAHVAALGYPVERTFTLTGASASRAGLVKTIEARLPQTMKADSTIFFYFAGKAVRSDGKDYLLPSDGDPAFLEETAYPVARLLDKLGALHARLTVVALDAPVSVEVSSAPAALYAVAASSAGAEGAFSRLFFEGLDGAAKGPNDVVTLGSIADYIAAKSAPPSALPSRQRLAEVVLH